MVAILPYDPAIGILLPSWPQTRNPRYFAVPQGLIGYWGFDPDCVLSSTTTADLSSNSNTGTLTGPPTTQEGTVGRALRFQAGQYVASSTLAGFGTSSRATFTAWVYSLANQAAFAGIAATRSGSNGFAGLHVSGAGTNQLTCEWLGTEFSYNSGVFFVNNQWCLCVGVITPTATYFYVNGVQGTTLVQTNTSQTLTAFEIGNDHVGHDRPFNGYIDEVRIYNRALDAGEIQVLYQVGLAGRRDAGWMLPGECEMSELGQLLVRRTLHEFGTRGGTRRVAA